jgi:undecaprenyl-diphosphatase
MRNGDSAIIRPQWKKTEVFGLLMMLAGLAIFVILAAQLGTPSVQRFDETVVRSLRNAENPAEPIGPGWFKELARDFTALGGYGILSTITILVTTFLHLERRPARAHFVVVTIVAGYTLSMVLKAVIARPRPDIVPWLSHVHSSSFPSGHSMMSAVVYLSLGLMLSDLTSRRR